MKEKLIALAKETEADIIGFAPASRFSPNDPIFTLLPEVKTVIGFGFRVLRGCYRGVEEGTCYYQYTTMGVENMEETVMPMTLMRVSALLEEEGYLALPQRRHQKIMTEKDNVNPEVYHDVTVRGAEAECQMNFEDAAVKCGLGEIGLHGKVLCDEFGPFLRYVFILTDAKFEASPLKSPHLCDRCGECVKACPGHAIAEDGTVDNWCCATYYRGANGTKNPFMPFDAYENFEDRIAIIAGEAEISPEKAKEILSETTFLPGCGHFYTSCVCGRACDIACYCHLEEKELLTRNFVSKFRERDPWAFDIKDFENQ